MRRRLTRSILFVTAMTLLTLGLPLAIVVSRYYENSATVDLQRRAAEGLAELPLPFDAATVDEFDLGEDAPFGVYDTSGALIAGSGPARADRATTAAMRGEPSFDHSTETLVYASPQVEPGAETVTAVVRVAEPDTLIDARIHRAWAIMAVAGGVALVGAWVVATSQARRIARPITQLAAAAEQLGEGGVLASQQRTGIAELDVLSDALSTSSVRLAELVARERAFSDDVSHQLRTPLTGLRLRIDAVVRDEPQRSELMSEIDRLQATIEQLLALNRDALPSGVTHSLRDLVLAAGTRWRPRLAALGRRLDVTADERVESVAGSPVALAQIVDVLVDNAVVHGSGTVTVVLRSIAGGAAIEVGDDGVGIDPDEAGKIFDRRHGQGNGIGLALARSLAEAEGGRLMLTRLRPARFGILLTAEPIGDEDPPGRALDQAGSSNR